MQLPAWQAIQRDDARDQDIRTDVSWEKMCHLWEVMKTSVEGYDPHMRSRSGLVGGDGGKMLDYAENKLRREGYVPYYLYRQKYMSGGFENVGWCKPGYVNEYNICMMEELSDVIALGSGGVSKLCSEGGRKVNRVANPKFPKEYIERIETIADGKAHLLDE